MLKCPRANYYRYRKHKGKEKTKDNLTDLVIEIFKDSKSNYGSRRIKAELSHRGIRASRKRIRRIMVDNFLFSSYQEAYFKPHHKKTIVNNEPVTNIVDFDNIPKGTIGSVVEIWEKNKFYEIEFFDKNHETIKCISMMPSQFRKLTADELEKLD